MLVKVLLGLAILVAGAMPAMAEAALIRIGRA
jgi:hypothetical protein